MENQPIWVLVNCNADEEGEKIGRAILGKRLGSCFDIFPRKLTEYFWPPKSDKIEKTGGCLLVIETLIDEYQDINSQVKKLHSDKLPFIGYIEIKGVSQEYLKWLKGEIK